ncbi:tripartite ATP-independent transporter solute receptor, DctP family [Lentibacillus persicus]|uniref:Tripartite ATP-independent transporter solute receptor, DctP family n=1 Tax=Lentibacillus persicus TaxID=640948 RepID=A0A1I1SBY3_9BACI|nr:DctP family TRAP transporter solute-binding subunit [Lentibacillus persicus]SFD44034.1 tripartite ATP-independent transporter solute receptor, DctP family [Lentibacillus persicus]
MKNFKRTTTLIMIAVFAIVLAACSGGDGDGTEGSSDAQTLRVGHTLTESTATHIALESFKETVEANSDGAITVELYPNGQLYSSERSAIEAVQGGNMEMTVTATAPVVGFVPEYKVLDLPFLFPDNETAYEALDGELGSTLLEKLPEAGLKGLVYGETGMRQLSTGNKPIEKPEDLEGVKMRTMENDVHIEAFETYGASPEPFAFGELYSALQQNTFDGMENPLNLIDQMKFYEVQEYLTISNHAYTATLFFINNDLFEGMSEENQTVIEEAAVEFRDSQRELAQENAQKGMEAVQGEMEITELTEDQRQAFIDASQPVYDTFQDDIGQELMDLALSYRE